MRSTLHTASGAEAVNISEQAVKHRDQRICKEEPFKLGGAAPKGHGATSNMNKSQFCARCEKEKIRETLKPHCTAQNNVRELTALHTKGASLGVS